MDGAVRHERVALHLAHAHGAVVGAALVGLARDGVDRAAACRTMLQTISDTAPIVPVCFEKHCLYVHRGAVGGFAPTKYNIFRNITDWKISQA